MYCCAFTVLSMLCQLISHHRSTCLDDHDNARPGCCGPAEGVPWMIERAVRRYTIALLEAADPDRRPGGRALPAGIGCMRSGGADKRRRAPAQIRCRGGAGCGCAGARFYRYGFRIFFFLSLSAFASSGCHFPDAERISNEFRRNCTPAP